MSQSQETSAAPPSDSPANSPESPPDLSKLFFKFTGSLGELGRTALLVGKEHVIKTAEGLRVEAQVAWHDAKDGASAILKEVKDGAETLYNDVKSDAQAAVRGTLDSIAVHPDEQKSAVAQIVRALPGIGPTTKYADAWKLWHNGIRLNDETKKEQARVDCLLAIGDAGIDITLLGSKLFCSIAKGTRHILGPMIGARTARSLGTEGDLLTQLARTVAQSEPAKSITEFLLNSVIPNAPKEDLAVRAPKIEKELDQIVDQFTKTEESASTEEGH